MHVATFRAHVLAVNWEEHKHISARTCLEYKNGGQSSQRCAENCTVLFTGEQDTVIRDIERRAVISGDRKQMCF